MRTATPGTPAARKTPQTEPRGRTAAARRPEARRSPPSGWPATAPARTGPPASPAATVVRRQRTGRHPGTIDVHAGVKVTVSGPVKTGTAAGWRYQSKRAPAADNMVGRRLWAQRGIAQERGGAP